MSGKALITSGVSCSATISYSHEMETPDGTLLLRECCPPSLVERLKADSGLRAFARLPEREHELLLKIAQRPDCNLTLAYTLTGEIVGEVTIAPADSWWDGLEYTREIAIQVSSNWRKLGVARHLLAFALEHTDLEESILLAMGLSWHWDTEGLGLDRFSYRELIARLFARHGFAEYLTSEPNIKTDPANILLARIGSRVEQKMVNRFINRTLQSEALPGL
jgi:GNAT superfamily N-acetyltransferase